MTLENAAFWLEMSGRPFWKLYAKEGMGAYELVAEYVNGNEDGTTATAKSSDLMADSLSQFGAKVELFRNRPNLTLKLVAKTSSKSNVDTQSAFLFKFEEATAQPQNGVSGLGEMQRMMTQNEVHYERLRELDRERHILDTERLLFNQKKEAFEAEMKAERARIAELEKEYSTNSNRVKKGLEMAIGSKIDSFLNGVGISGQAAPAGSNLAGTEEEVERDPREMVIEKIASYIDENVPGFNQVVWLERKIVSIVEAQKSQESAHLDTSDVIPEA